MKVEGGERRIELIARLVEAEIPVMGHVGLTPQSVNALGGFHVQGTQRRSRSSKLLRDARAVEAAGAFAIVLESLPRELAAQITARAAAFPLSASAQDPIATARSSCPRSCSA